MDADRTPTVFISILLNWNEFEGGFAIMKRSTKYSGEAALANWFNQLEWKTSTLFITLQIVRTVLAGTVETRTWKVAGIILKTPNLLSKACSLKL